MTPLSLRTALAVAAVALAATRTFALDLFVAPDGRDTWSGRLVAAAADGDDGPFATIERARDAIRELKKAGGLDEPVTVRLRGGTYELAAPLQFTPEDSGRAEQPVTYCSYDGETAAISGGRRITGWRRQDDRLWVADVPWIRERQSPFYQLFVNGQRRTRARTPNTGTYLYTRRLLLTNDAFPVCSGMVFAEGDVTPWRESDDAAIVLFHNWVTSVNYVAEADWGRRRLSFTQPAGIFFLGPRVRYYVEGTFDALDAPGEWYLDSRQGVVYYYPVPDEDLLAAEVVAPALQTPIVQLTGDPEVGMYVEDLVFRGLSFQHADADISPDYPHSVQGCVYQKGAVFATGMRDSIIEDCEFTHLGEHAVSLREGCVGNAVRRCHVHDVGGGGIYLSETTLAQRDEALIVARNVVDNNFIHDGGHIFHSGVGVFLGGSASYNEITHNEICDLSWIGVHLGWSWTGRAPTDTHHNTVAYNHIHHIGNGVLNDIGGIYTLGVSTGTVLDHNLIHDVTRFERGNQGYGGWGIYLDAGSSEIRVENNIVYNTRDGGFHAHCDGYPYGDEVLNNIFAYSDDAQMVRNNNKEPDGSHLRIERNIVYNANSRMYGGSNWLPEGKFSCDRNCYFSEATDEPDFYGKTFAEWQATGRDFDSFIGDPGFVNAPEHDFRLKPDSPVLALGFEPIDMTTVGLYGAEEWRNLPRNVIHRTFEAALPSEDAAGGAFVEDLEDYDVGEQPEGAIAPEGGAQVTVTDLLPATGERCMEFTDAPGVTVWKPHWCVWRTPRPGTVRSQCAVRNDPTTPATIELEFRDWDVNAGAAYSTGPYIRFFPDGTVSYARGNEWVPIGQYRIGQWTHVEVEFEQGAGKPKTFTFRLGEQGGPTKATEGLPFRSDAFEECTWVGFAGVDQNTAVFYVDDVRID